MNDNSVGTVGVAVVLLIVVTAGAVGAFQFAANGGGNDDAGNTESEFTSDGDSGLESAGDGGDSGGNESASDGNGTDGENAANESGADSSSDGGGESAGDGASLADEDDGNDERDSDTGATETGSNESVGSQDNGEGDDSSDGSDGTDSSGDDDQASDNGTADEQASDNETTDEQASDNETTDEQASNNETADEPDYPGGMQVEVVDLPPQLNTEGQTPFGVAVRSPGPESGEAILRLDGEVVDTAEYTTRAGGSLDYAEGGAQLFVDDPDVEAGELYPVTIETDHGDVTFEIRAYRPVAP